MCGRVKAVSLEVCSAGVRSRHLRRGRQVEVELHLRTYVNRMSVERVSRLCEFGALRPMGTFLRCTRRQLPGSYEVRGGAAGSEAA